VFAPFRLNPFAPRRMSSLPPVPLITNAAPLPPLRSMVIVETVLPESVTRVGSIVADWLLLASPVMVMVVVLLVVAAWQFDPFTVIACDAPTVTVAEAPAPFIVTSAVFEPLWLQSTVADAGIAINPTTKPASVIAKTAAPIRLAGRTSGSNVLRKASRALTMSPPSVQVGTRCAPTRAGRL